MKANLQTAEPAALERWAAMDLYGRIRAARRGARQIRAARRPARTPTARSTSAPRSTRSSKTSSSSRKSMAGFDAPYVPGYDCHGLPIELKVDRELGPKKRDMSIADVRRACRAYAERFIGVMTKEFQRLGVFGDWDHPYLTMKFEYQADIARALGRFVEQGLVYKGKKPVHWCIHCRTALAEAEVEYDDHASPSIYVEFPLNPESAAELVARIPALAGPRRVGAHLDDDSVDHPLQPRRRVPSRVRLRGLRRRRAGGDRRRGTCRKASQKRWDAARSPDRTDEGRAARGHPLSTPPVRARFGRRTGHIRHARARHWGRAHGAGPRRRRLPHRHQVRARHLRASGAWRPLPRHRRVVRGSSGSSTPTRRWKRRSTIEAASGTASTFEHQYPHCWRCHNPVIFLATSQWFVRLDGEAVIAGEDGSRRTLRDAARHAIDHQVSWIPALGTRPDLQHGHEPARLVHLAPARVGRAHPRRRLRQLRRGHR